MRTTGCGALLLVLLIGLAGWWVSRHWRDLSDRVVVIPREPSVVQITPETVSLQPGGSQQFVATVRSGSGTVIPASVSWTATGGTITTAGLYTAGGAAGAFEVQAAVASASISDAASVTVVTGASSADRIDLQGDVASSPSPPAVATVTLLDGKVLHFGSAPGDVPTCLADTPLTGGLVFANLEKNDCGFRDEIAVFSFDNEALIDSLPTTQTSIWTSATGESRVLPLRPSLAIPLTVWVATGPTVTTLGVTDTGAPEQVVQDVLEVVDDDVSLMQALLNTNLVGLQFTVTVHRAWEVVDAPAAIGNTCSASVRPTWYTEGTLNVYYVPAVQKPNGGARAGWYCGSFDTPDGVKDPHTIYISFLERNFTLLAHEVGHALGLLHTGSGAQGELFNPAAALPQPFTDDNIMWDASGAPRSTFSLGQAFRMNFDTRTSLFSLGLRGPAGRRCECTLFDDGCGLREFYRQLDLGGAACPRISVTP